MRFPLADSPAGGVGPRRGFISIARAAWAPVGANATKPPIWRYLRPMFTAPKTSRSHTSSPALPTLRRILTGRTRPDAPLTA